MLSVVLSAARYQQLKSITYTYQVCVHLELHPQYRIGDVVDQLCSAHPTTASNVEAKASIRIVWGADRARCCIDNCPQVGKVLDSRRGERCRHKDDASEEHAGQQGVDLGVNREHAKLSMRLANVEVARQVGEVCRDEQWYV